MKSAFENYFASLDGKSGWDLVRPHFDELMHEDVVIVTANGDKSKAEWAEAVKGLIAKGAVASNLEMTEPVGNEFHYKLTLTIGDMVMSPASKGTIQDGQLIRVEPVDPQTYSALSRR